MLKYVKFGLFDYQEEETERLHKQKSRLLAWEMGTGKTYGGIALDIENRGRSVEAMEGGGKARKTLVIAPKSVLGVWDEHCMELTDLDVYVFDIKDRKQFIRDLQNPKAEGYFIINWEGIRLKDIAPVLQKTQFFHIIADECHRAKNRKAQQTIALKKIPTLYKTALSGTPADNKPHDLWSILNWLWPKVYTSYWNFYKAYINSEMSFQGYRQIVGVKNVQHLREQMKPWYSRKLKKDVLKDLPDKYYSTIWVDLDPKQKAAYKEMQNTMVAWVKEREDELDNPIIAQAVISQLIRLQQFAVGYVVPRLDEQGMHMFKWKWPKGMAKEIKERFKHNPEEGGAKKQYQYDMQEPSSKIDAIVEMLNDNEDEQIVVFSQFKAAINLLGQRLDRLGISHGLYTGDTSQEDRNQIVRDFQAGDIRVFAGTVAAGGVGITLTNASTVVFLDKAWSPALNAQAEDRLHRIGQKSAVQVIDLMAKGTVDIGRKQMLEKKMEWLRSILGDQVANKLHLQFGDNDGFEDLN